MPDGRICQCGTPWRLHPTIESVYACSPPSAITGMHIFPWASSKRAEAPLSVPTKFIACFQSSATAVLSNSMDDLVLSLSQQSIARGVHT